MQESPTYEQETYRTNGKLTALPTEAPTMSRTGLKNPSLALYSAIPIVLGIFVWYVWPTPYETYQQNGTTIRINRFTGETQTLQATGWMLSSIQAPQALGENALHSISVDQSEINRGTLHARIYNGTNNRLDSVTLFVTILNKDRTIKLERTYLAHPEDAGNGTAYGDSGFGARCSVPLGPGETYRVAVAGASGAVTSGLAPVSVATNSKSAEAASITQLAPVSAASVPPAGKPAPAAVAAVVKTPRPVARVAVLPPPAPVAVVHSMPLSVGAAIPHPVAPLQSAIAKPTITPLPKTPSVVSPSVLNDPVKTGGLTPLQLSGLQQRYDTYKHDGQFETDPKAQAWGLAALARNIVHDDHKPDLSKVPTSVLEDSLHMINTYKPEDFLRG